MHYTIAIASLLSLTSAAAVTKRYPATLVERQSGVCGALATPSCCQLDVLGVADLNCANAGPVSSTEEFKTLCAETGTSAQCCVLPLGGDALVCTSA
ncbi:fungal hydrophobin-domain-containing protein [Paraphoma chrysanthemicola]|uniref:Fungal hydrophobin-domain-containing protein n=1 Tax=Paraphoma chrysanthemicola TaxID=798071 RepID=A0A8K0VRG5_9PLEO|nr:fungal hydrophobin-domain-containing protein [Paraphoma chrysanthemicola]